MADLLFDYINHGKVVGKFSKLYRNTLNIKKGLSVYHNDNIIQIKNDKGSAIIIGFACVPEGKVEQYVENLLNNFSQEKIPIVKKELVGQYLIVLTFGSTCYLFSDFLAVRTFFYSKESKLVCSSFEVLYDTLGDNAKFQNMYNYYEFITMKKCCYPGWLNNTTFDNRIFKLRGYEYIVLNTDTGECEIKDFIIEIDNTKNYDIALLKKETLDALKKTSCFPEYKGKTIHSTLTGGFDSRLITSIVCNYYPNTSLRIASFKDVKSLDLFISRRLSRVFDSSLIKYVIDQDVEDDFYLMTDYLSPKDNSIMTEMFRNANDCELGFGGAFGSELYSTLPFDSILQMIEGFKQKAVETMPDNNGVDLFIESLNQEIQDITDHFSLNDENEKDIVRLFILINTSAFASQFISAYDILGKQCEPIASFSVIEKGLQIPYEYQGSPSTYGRFYLIPKMIVEQINYRAGKVMSSHFCPMLPLSLRTVSKYLIGKLSYKFYLPFLKKKNRKKAIEAGKWDEGFVKKYLS